LILKNPRCWNEALIKQIFFQHEAEEILSIRILEIEGDDILAWHFEKMVYSQSGAHTNLQQK
jgi:hypothetical protein